MQWSYTPEKKSRDFKHIKLLNYPLSIILRAQQNLLNHWEDKVVQVGY